MTLAIISCQNKVSALLFDEKPMINQDTTEITLMYIRVVLRPNLSSIYPDRRPPTGEKIAVIEANQLAWDVVNLTSMLSSFKSGRVVAGYPT